VNFVDGRDVALAHVRAAMVGKPGERYIIGGHNLNVAAALHEAALIAGVRPPGHVLTLRTTTALLTLADLLRLPIPENIRTMRYWQPVNAEKGWQTFDLTPRPYTETVQDTLIWFRSHGYLAPSAEPRRVQTVSPEKG
jgi:dihydroflavonol-4-reductase